MCNQTVFSNKLVLYNNGFVYCYETSLSLAVALQKLEKEQLHRETYVQNVLPRAWCPISCETIKETKAFLFIKFSIGQ